MDKQRVLERLQTLGDIVDERFGDITITNAKRLEGLIEEAFELLCRRKGDRRK